ncbi:Rha family phage regulatory protein [Cytobacillus horneckiae]|uniref:Rha family transcriptional regulator n=1 Tax=Cytobacillus horneckiae TaxID=549687 RepID=UPI0019D0EEF9|nr:Rha family transcriptional regulator [Cytobacillus horneckiae]MBN6889937.1 Rha family transcriptional regulator [Cytobacillus horneckiae]
MNQLVFIENNQAVTNSLIVAEAFQKSHDKVLRDIRNLGCSEDFRVANFGESSYLNSQNKKLPMMLMNKKGFTLLAMGYTGKEAMIFKEAYINQFERMEQELKGPRVLSEREQLMASMKLSLETAEEINQVKGEVKEIRHMVEEQITLTSGEQRRLQKGIAQKVYKIENDQKARSSLFRELHREIKDRFGVASYKDIKRKELQSALSYIEHWIPRKVS